VAKWPSGATTGIPAQGMGLSLLGPGRTGDTPRHSPGLPQRTQLPHKPGRVAGTPQGASPLTHTLCRGAPLAWHPVETRACRYARGVPLVGLGSVAEADARGNPLGGPAPWGCTWEVPLQCPLHDLRQRCAAGSGPGASTAPVVSWRARAEAAMWTSIGQRRPQNDL